jgi:hypothetical protein
MFETIFWVSMDGSEIFDSFHTNYFIVFIIFEIYCFPKTKQKIDSKQWMF